MNATKIGIAALTIALLAAGASYAGSNGEPHYYPTGGGAPNGIGMLGGSYQSDGTLIVGIGTTANAITEGTGAWEVDFRRLLTGCVWSGAIGLGTFGGNTGAGQIQVTGRGGNTRALYIETYNASGTHANLPFEVTVICG